MNKKKSLFSLFLGAVMYSAVMPLVSAQWVGGGLSDILYRGPSQLIQIIKDFTSPFFEVLLNTTAYEEFFFAKVLFLLLLFIIVYFVLKKSEFLGLERNRWALFIISAIVSILSMRYLPENDFIKGMLLPYGALGVAILTFLPFVIYFFFIHKSDFGHFGRRAGWAVYAVVFLVLWRSRAAGMSDASNAIYVSGLVLVVLAFIFDSSIHKYFGMQDFRRHTKESKLWEKIEIEEKMEKLMRAMEKGRLSQSEYDKEIEKLTQRYEKLTEN